MNNRISVIRIRIHCCYVALYRATVDTQWSCRRTPSVNIFHIDMFFVSLNNNLS